MKRVILILLLCSCAGLLACNAPADSSFAQDIGAPNLPPQELVYALRWDTSDVTLNPDSGGLFELVNDKAVRFVVDRGWLTSYSFEALVCAKGAGQNTWLPSLRDILIPRAWAGHSDIPVGPAKVRASFVEDLALLDQSQTAAVVLVNELRICRLHLVLARADQFTSRWPTEVDMDTTTLHLEGRYLQGDVWQSFQWRTDVAWADIYDLPTEWDTGWGGVEITVVRSLKHLLDGIDPKGQDPKDAARQVLQNVIEHVVIQTKSHLN
ncbi:MAG TPA: hypothetical protein DCQ06_02900 [Myxococcales bacterium]|nr:hypothetical protein [Myxococcales bacterium]